MGNLFFRWAIIAGMGCAIYVGDAHSSAVWLTAMFLGLNAPLKFA